MIIFNIFIVLYYIILYFIILYHIILYYSMLYYIILYFFNIISYYIILYYRRRCMTFMHIYRSQPHNQWVVTSTGQCCHFQCRRCGGLGSTCGGLGSPKAYPRYDPWCWQIYLQNWIQNRFIYGVNVGKYSRTMEHMAMGFSRYSYSYNMFCWCCLCFIAKLKSQKTRIDHVPPSFCIAMGRSKTWKSREMSAS